MQGGYGAAKSVPDFDRAIALKPDFRYAYINRANARFMRHPWLAIADFHQGRDVSGKGRPPKWQPPSWFPRSRWRI